MAGRNRTETARSSDRAVAFRYALARWTALIRYAQDDRLEIDYNAVERSLRGIDVGRKSWLFAGSDQGGHRADRIYSLVETARQRSRPEAWLADAVSRIAVFPPRRLAELLP